MKMVHFPFLLGHMRHILEKMLWAGDEVIHIRQSFAAMGCSWAEESFETIQICFHLLVPREWFGLICQICQTKSQHK